VIQTSYIRLLREKAPTMATNMMAAPIYS
jgi:hypothetical protein